MGADRSRIRLTVGLCIAGLLLAVLFSTLASAQATSAATPTTAAQCKQRYRKGSQARAACIKRVNTPGSSCAKPLESYETSYGPSGDAADITAELVGFNPNELPGESQTVQARVTLHSSRVVICPKVTFIVRIPGESLKRYYATVGPEGGLSTSVTVPNGDIEPGAAARLK
jgi:hypothetical protein